jgi:hypothetical protein
VTVTLLAMPEAAVHVTLFPLSETVDANAPGARTSSAVAPTAAAATRSPLIKGYLLVSKATLFG